LPTEAGERLSLLLGLQLVAARRNRQKPVTADKNGGLTPYYIGIFARS
jgi:hypothetical protein